MPQHLLREGLILGKKKIDGGAIVAAGSGICSKVGNKVAALLEILVARGALLSVPALLIDENNRRQNRQLLNGKRQMRQIGNRAVSVLEIKCVEKLLSLLLADLLERLLHGQRRARILGHGIGL